MGQKIHPRGVIWVLSSPPHAGHLLEKKNDDLAVQYEDCSWSMIIITWVENIDYNSILGRGKFGLFEQNWVNIIDYFHIYLQNICTYFVYLER